MTQFLLTILVWAALFSAQSDKIAFSNASFEDKNPRASASPPGWNSYTQGSTPDILPGAWGLELQPQHGKTCVGLVTRENGTSEDICQTLDVSLQQGKCYEFTVYLASAPKYVGYNKPTRMRVWGGATKGAKTQLLTATPLIDHPEWKKYTLQFEPNASMNHITLEAWFAPGVLFFYRGNLLLDNLSELELCDRA